MPTKKRPVSNEITRQCVICGDTFTFERRPGGRPITCSDECRRIRSNQVIKRWRETAECPDKYHGTIIGYQNFMCACSDCRRAAREYRQKNRLEKKAQTSG